MQVLKLGKEVARRTADGVWQMAHGIWSEAISHEPHAMNFEGGEA